jgi:hypothetical protein
MMVTTVCTRCRHFMNLDPHSCRADVWYNHLCLATPLPTRIDPYDGKVKPCGVNDLGTPYFSDEAFQNCRYVNNGNCQKYVVKED